MTFYKQSTNTNPILFFETFINNETLASYEDMFYNNPINPSQMSFRDKGYIHYTKDLYEHGEVFKPVRVYFKQELQSLLNSQIFITKNFLLERKDKLEYQNIKPDIFIEKQLCKIQALKKDCEKITVYKEIITEVLNTIEKFIKETGEVTIVLPQYISKDSNNNSNSNCFFKNKNFTDVPLLKELYGLAVKYEIIDNDFVLQQNFVNVLMSSTPDKIEDKIVFKSDNQISVGFLYIISPLFKNLTHSQITKSKSFYNNHGKLLNQVDLDTAKSRGKKKLTDGIFLEIYELVRKSISKRK